MLKKKLSVVCVRIRKNYERVKLYVCFYGAFDLVSFVWVPSFYHIISFNTIWILLLLYETIKNRMKSTKKKRKTKRSRREREKKKLKEILVFFFGFAVFFVNDDFILCYEMPRSTYCEKRDTSYLSEKLSLKG